MDKDLLRRRRELVDRHDALAPQGGQPGTASVELSAVAEGLEAIAREAETGGDRSVEVGRTWRWAGMAYYDAAPDRDEAMVQRAVAAYEQSERSIDRTVDVVDAAKTDYCMGRALLNLADGPDGSVAQQAVDRLVRARAGARGAAPELLPAIEEALVSAEHVAALRAQTNEYDDRIQQLSSEMTGSVNPNDEQLSLDDIKGLFAIVQQQFDQEQVSMNPVRRDSLSDVLDGLAGLMDKAGTDRSLSDMAGEKETFDKLVEQMKPLLRRAGDE